LTSPVEQMVYQADREIVYALRIKDTSFRPKRRRVQRSFLRLDREGARRLSRRFLRLGSAGPTILPVKHQGSIAQLFDQFNQVTIPQF